MKTPRFNNQVFLRLLLSYCMVLAVPILMGWFAYWQTIRMTEASTKDNNITMLRHSSQLIENYLDEVKSITVQMAMNPKLSELLAAKTIDNFLMMQFLRETQSHPVTNPFFTQWYIYLKNSDYVIFSGTMYRSDFFYRNVFHYKQLPYSEWQKSIWARYYRGEFRSPAPTVLEQFEGSTLTFLQSVPLSFNRKQPDGLIAILINENEFFNLLPKNITEAGGWIYITDENNRVIADSAGSQHFVRNLRFQDRDGCRTYRFSGRKMLVTYMTSERNGWRYIAAIPESVVMGKVYFVRILAWIVTLLSLFLGLAMACFLARKNAEPIRGIIRMLSEFFGTEKEREMGDFEYLNGRISELITNSRTSQAAAERQIPYATTTFFEHLLKGEFTSNEEVNAFAAYIGATIRGDSFRVVILQMYSATQLISAEILKELDMTKYVIKDTLRTLLGDYLLVHDLDENRMVLIMGFESESSGGNEPTAAIVKRIYDQTLERYHVKLSFAVGEPCRCLLAINQSYEQALLAANYLSLFEKDQQIVWYRDIPKETQDYQYSLDIELRLINFTKAGDLEEVRRILEGLYDENIRRQQLSPQTAAQFMQELLGTLVKLRQQADPGLPLKELIDAVNAVGPVDQVFGDISRIFYQLCERIGDQKRSHNDQLKNEILQYIQEAYRDPSIYLSGLALQFGLTEAYLSHFFKEQTGENFSVYLERIRLEHAYDLLANTNMPIHEIAAAVGYNGDQVFRRAFKRVNSISPNEYREQHRAV